METPGYYQGKIHKAQEIDELEGVPINVETACEILLTGISAGDKNITTHDCYSLLRICSLGGLVRNHLLLDLSFS